MFSKAWNEGKWAGSQGESKNSNPYRAGQDMTAWWKGWDEGQKEAQNAVQEDQTGQKSG